MQKSLEIYNETNRKLKALAYCGFLSGWDINTEIRTGSFSGIEKWLAEKIHRFGASKDPKDILVYATGEEFNPNYYIDYLVGKYSKLYGLYE